MAPPRGLAKKPTSNSSIPKIVAFVKSCIFDPAKLPLVSVGILLVELLLNVIVVQRVPYTEIDWVAYMQECEGFLNGTTNYSLLRGKFFADYPAPAINNYSGTLFQVTRDRWCTRQDSSTSTRCSTSSRCEALSFDWPSTFSSASIYSN